VPTRDDDRRRYVYGQNRKEARDALDELLRGRRQRGPPTNQAGDRRAVPGLLAEHVVRPERGTSCLPSS
jgi:hypothetical protein